MKENNVHILNILNNIYEKYIKNNAKDKQKQWSKIL